MKPVAGGNVPASLLLCYTCPLCGSVERVTHGVVFMDVPYQCSECATTLVFSVRSPEMDAMHDEVSSSEDGPQW